AIRLVEVKLGARTAGSGVSDRPKVVRVTELVNALSRQALLRPKLERLFVPGQPVLAVEDGRREPLGVEAQQLGHQLPGAGDGVRLEVVAEREVAQHLEERVVPPGEADVVQIVVFAPGADAFLGAGGTRVVALLPAGKNVLELDHPGVGEKQRRVVQRDERRGPNPAVASLLEESKEGFSD